ncbi:MAG: EcsC family protein [Peptococcaceae bacterium]
MSSYDAQVKRELARWEKKLLAGTGFVEKLSRNIQQKIDSYIPAKVHNTICKALELGIKSILGGINLIPVNTAKLQQTSQKNLAELDREVDIIAKRYKKLAAVTGAGTGWGGILSLAVDYPALISLELKMLQEIAQAFGYDIRDKKERLYILKVFLLAFSADESRKKTYLELISQDCRDLDWQELYWEYKERVEFKKMLQILPGFGAVIGAWANYGLIDDLAGTARNCYRLRYFKHHP